MSWMDVGRIVENKVLLAAMAAWFIAQAIKVLISILGHKKLDFRRFVNAGGMPSSTVMAMSTGVGMRAGFDSAIFAVAITVSFIIMYDAAGVRRAAGKQAAALNRILDHMKKQGVRSVLQQHPFQELLGHTPVEVFVGALLGIVIALWIV